MKQRLGIAHALLGDPSVLILDEPANGLDPAGIRWMRGLLKGYADRGGTVLLSSHLLNEVELIADEMILIGHGRIVAQGNKEQLLANADHTVTNVTSLDNAALAQALQAKGITVHRPPAPASGSTRPPSTSAGSRPSSRSSSPTCAPPTAASRTCSSSSPATPSATTSPQGEPGMSTTAPDAGRHPDRHRRDAQGVHGDAREGRAPQGAGHPGRPLARRSASSAWSSWSR